MVTAPATSTATTTAQQVPAATRVSSSTMDTRRPPRTEPLYELDYGVPFPMQGTTTNAWALSESKNGSKGVRQTDGTMQSKDGHDSDLKSRQMKSTVGIFRRFAENCSMQGPLHIYYSTWWFPRFAWTCLLMLALGTMTFHLVYLCQTYFSYGTKNKMTLGFSSLQFPAVTVCNVNAVRSSKLSTMSSNFQLFVKTVYTTYNNSSNSTLDNIYSQLIALNLTTGQQGVESKSYNDNNLQGYSDSWQGLSNESTVYAIDQIFKELYSSESRDARIEAGHQIKDMLLSCSFAGRTCPDSLITNFTSTTFGNCFTLEYDKFISRKSGPTGGLELIFFLETDEYIKGLTQATGLQVNVHQQKSMAHPVDDGVAAAAGSQTLISFILSYVSHKGKPYGTCNTDAQFLQKYGIKYSKRACHGIYGQGMIHAQCQCYDPNEEMLNIVMNTTHFPPCQTQTQTQCLQTVTWNFQNNRKASYCKNACLEAQYETSISQRPWPSKDYAASVLISQACEQLSESRCQALRNKNPDDLSRQEFVKLNVFYKDLNYKNITEEPDYSFVKFVSDIGGMLGLWVGLSMLSVMEIVQLCMQLLRHLCCCRWMRRVQ